MSGPIIERPLRPYLALEIFDDRNSAFTFDASRLDIARLGDGTIQPEWDDWINQAVSINVRRGAARDEITMNNDVGTLTVALRRAAIDVIAPAFVAGQPLRLVFIDGGQRHLLFTGTIRDIGLDVTLSSSGERVPVVTLIAVDATVEHLAVTRYGAMPPTGSETFGERITRLSTSARAPIEPPPEIPGPTPGIDAPLLGRTVYESSLANHLTLACNTVGAMWHVGVDGITRFQDRVFDADSAIAFVDGSSDFEAGDHPLHVLQETLRAGTENLFNVPIFHVLSAVPDEDDPTTWVADEQDVTGNALPGPLMANGRRPVTIMTNHAEPPREQGEAWAWVVPYADPTGVIDALTWNAQEDLARVPQVDIGASIITQRSIPQPGTPPHAHNLVIGINHNITPTRWIVGLTLIGAANRGI